MTRYNGKAYYYTCSTEKASPSATEEMFFYDLVLVNGTNYHDDDHTYNCRYMFYNMSYI